MKRLEPQAMAAILSQLHRLSAVEAVTRLAELEVALPMCCNPELLRQLGKALPARIAGLQPEVALALHQVVEMLLFYEPQLPGDIEALPPGLAVPWQRLQLAVGNSDCLEAITEERLLQVVTGWSLHKIQEPAALLAHLAKASDARLREQALKWLRPGVETLAITPQQAFDCLARLASDEHQKIRCSAIEMLASCWLLGLKPISCKQREELLACSLREKNTFVVQAAVATTAALRLGHLLRQLVTDKSAFLANRCEALRSMGQLSQEADLELLFEMTSAEPLAAGPAARSFLLEAHRCGVFLHEQHLADVLSLFDNHHSWSGEELVRVTYLARSELLGLLAKLDADDSRWLRRAEILAASYEPAAATLIAKLLRCTKESKIAEALVQAAGRCAEFSDEQALLIWLDDLPEAVLSVLRVKGGKDAAARLLHLVKDPFYPETLRRLALPTLWALTVDREGLRRDLSSCLGPWTSGVFDPAPGRDSQLAGLLLQAPWEETPENVIPPIKKLKTLCETGDWCFLPQVTELFRQVFCELVQKALDGDFTVKRLQMPILEQQIFRYGRFLLQQGRIVRTWLADEPETGRDLLLGVCCDWLGEKPETAVTVALLELIGRHKPTGFYLQALKPYWRHGNREVQRAAIEALAQAGSGARGLELSVGRLVAAKNPKVVRQALAVVRSLEARWAEPLVLAALRRSEMGVKKEAALALAKIGSSQAVPALVELLATHDNRSYRQGLFQALQKAAGAATSAVLVDALEEGSKHQVRRSALICQALNGCLGLSTAVRLAHLDSPAQQQLLQALLDGEVTLAGATSDDLAAALHKLDMLPQNPREDCIRQLRLHGFSAEVALQLVKDRQPKQDPALLTLVKKGFVDWKRWLLAEGEQLSVEAFALVLDAADRSHLEHLGEMLECVTLHQDRLVPGEAATSVLRFVERCFVDLEDSPGLKLRAAQLLRQLAPCVGIGGRRRFRLLGRLGALIVADDLLACLSECWLGSDLAGESASILCAAFSIDGPQEGESKVLTELREQAESWYQLEASQREEWLTKQLQERPLGLTPAGAMTAVVPPPKNRWRDQDLQGLGEPSELLILQKMIDDDDQRVRSLAAQRLLAWPDARQVWGDIEERFLRGELSLDWKGRQQLAGSFARWPEDRAQWPFAAELIPHFDNRLRRCIMQQWLAHWDNGVEEVVPYLEQMGLDLLLPEIHQRAIRGEHSLLRLLGPSSALAVRSLIQLVKEKDPSAIAHLMPKPTETAERPGEHPVDSIAGRELPALLDLIRQKDVERGLAVRAVHALVAYQDKAVEPLADLATDPRPAVRSAALRALRKVASRERSLEVTASVLQMEDRKDTVLQLMASLGHGRHPPTLRCLTQRLCHRNQRVADAAWKALLAWGESTAPALRHAASRARPDRRQRYTDLLALLDTNL